VNGRNPFEYVGANDLSEETICDYYIEDFNFSRFIKSTRNTLLVGERGCGKSMTLLYNSCKVQRIRASREGYELPLDTIGIYVPCNTPLTHKREFQLLDEFRASVISEHHLVLTIAYHVAKTLADLPDLLSAVESDRLREELSYLFGEALPANSSLFTALMQVIDRANIQAQRAANSRSSTDVFYENTFSFPSLIVPLLRLLSSSARLANTHFAFLVDDAHDLNDYQRKSLFSWIAYRDHSLFSFKVALAAVARSSLLTASGGSILEGHDYTRIDMVQPFHNETTDFGRLAELLVTRRLQKCGIPATPSAFFPVSSQMIEQLRQSEEIVRKEALTKYGEGNPRISDYVYKFKRAHFFRSRPATANRPEYSGFDTLVFLSTGVIRNLLMPCYWMYDKVLSLSATQHEHESGSAGNASPTEIPSGVQSEIILARSRALWDWVRNELDKTIEGCSRDNARRAYQLLDNLAILFRERLLKHKSEPRANSFTISRQSDPAMQELTQVLDILISAQLLYVRSGVAKEKGKRESYYVPNRMLWPERGLDPHGQHARVSIPAGDLWAAADKNRPLPFGNEDDSETSQPRLFDEA
jgi:hypothetical protein